MKIVTRENLSAKRQEMEITQEVQKEIDTFCVRVSQLTLEQQWKLANETWEKYTDRHDLKNNMRVLLETLGFDDLAEIIKHGLENKISSFDLMQQLLGETLNYANSDVIFAIVTHQYEWLIKQFVESLFGSNALTENGLSNGDLSGGRRLILNPETATSLKLPTSKNSLGFEIFVSTRTLPKEIDPMNVIATIVEWWHTGEYIYADDTLIGWLCIDGSIIFAKTDNQSE